MLVDTFDEDHVDMLVDIIDEGESDVSMLVDIIDEGELCGLPT